MPATPPAFLSTFLERWPAWVSSAKHLLGGSGRAKGLWCSREGACRDSNVGGGGYQGGWMHVEGRHKIK